MFYNFWKILSLILYNQEGYIGKKAKFEAAERKKIADQEAAILREQIASQERLTRETNEAMIKQSRNSAVGNIIGAAISTHTTTEQIKQLLPHERAASTMMAMDIAQKWNTTREMRESGYSNVAIEYALNNKNYKALYSDAQYSSMLYAEQAKKDLVTSIQTFGIRGPGNPTGIDMTPDQWLELHSQKEAKAMLEVDPEVARQRQAAFDKWEQQMRSEGKGILVDLYKHPELAGHGIQGMKGTDPLIPKELQGMVKTFMDGEGGTGDTDYKGAWEAMSRGETTPHTKEIEWAMSEGIIDKYGMPAMDALMSYIPPELAEAPQFDPKRQLTDQEKARLLDDYNKFSQIKIDPKLVKQVQMGNGVTSMTKLNADGTVAGTAMSGYMTNAMGEQVFMSMPGASLQDWTTKQTQMMSGLGPLFPGQLALSTQAEQSGSGLFDRMRTNQMARPNQGSAGPAMTTPKTGGAGGQPQQSSSPTMPGGMYGSPKGGGGQSGQTINQGSTPAGYEGAPLAAGED